jgi:ubiquinone/menaquinone biosynthesis C-methylase UbiE
VNILYKTRDECRANLLKYLLDVLSKVPVSRSRKIIDLGCGTGVVTAELAKMTRGEVYACDVDASALEHFRTKISHSDLAVRIRLINSSAFDLDFNNQPFDVVIAEGLLNVIGFENGLKLADRLLARSGFFVIHDEYADHENKMKLISEYNFQTEKTTFLTEKVWWNDYYQCLEEKINDLANSHEIKRIFASELSEIAMIKNYPERFRSIYYLLKKL